MPQLECDMTGDKKGTVEGTFYVAKGVAWSELRLSGIGPYMTKRVNGVKEKHGKTKWGCSAPKLYCLFPKLTKCILC